MAGGLLNLVAVGNQNIIINGNPTKSFFKIRYSKHTNFGMQKFRIDHNHTTEIKLKNESHFSFTIPRYADLLMNVFLVFKLPKIWSPIYNKNDDLRPYEFKWIKNIGTQIIKEVKFIIGNYEIQKFSGSYLQNVVERDFDSKKKELFDLMIGNTNDLNDPANYLNRNNNYPNAYDYNDNKDSDIEPSIYDKTIYVPIKSWFSMLNSSALPLICMQYDNLKIEFEFRPIKELFSVKNIDFSVNDINYLDIKADQNLEQFLYRRFVNPPPQRDISSSSSIYSSQQDNINFDIHLITTQCFLDNEERIEFANNNKEYLIKQVKVYPIFERINNVNKIKIETNGLVSNWMWYIQRNDVKDRNQWSNYTNWPYENIIPYNIKSLNDLSINNLSINIKSLNDLSNIYITDYPPTINQQQNFKTILNKFGIICDGKYREEDFDSGIYDKIEKYIHTNGNIKDGLYHYSFSLNTDSSKYQPTGAFNTSKYRRIEFEYHLKDPPIDSSSADFQILCDPTTGQIIATTQEPTSIYHYSYDLHLFEERYNILEFHSGTAHLMYQN